VLQALPAALRVLAVRLLEARRGGDLAVLPAGRVAVTGHVERRDHFLVELRAFLQHGLRRLEARLLEAGIFAISSMPARWRMSNSMSLRGAR
jgi:hypothetical protein